jgi:hypothetical protein
MTNDETATSTVQAASGDFIVTGSACFCAGTRAVVRVPVAAVINQPARQQLSNSLCVGRNSPHTVSFSGKNKGGTGGPSVATKVVPNKHRPPNVTSISTTRNVSARLRSIRGAQPPPPSPRRAAPFFVVVGIIIASISSSRRRRRCRRRRRWFAIALRVSSGRQPAQRRRPLSCSLRFCCASSSQDGALRGGTCDEKGRRSEGHAAVPVDVRRKARAQPRR